jgi:two-component system, NtrC family, nitrogen regulation response regulator NtrX
MSADILIVDDEASIRGMIKGILDDEGYVTRLAANSAQAYEAVKVRIPQLVILDIWLKDSEHDGLQILATVKKDNPQLPVLMISGHGTIETAVSAIKQGAYDFIEKPFKSDRLLLMIERALETARLRRENEALRAKAEGPSELIGDSAAMAALRQVLSRVAQTNSRILLTGEPGSGKDLAARAIHRLSRRTEGPFMAVNCAILNPDRLEVELFGEGSASGVLERAHGGTLLLDEVADMPMETQGKILRVLQDQKFQRVGGQTLIEVDVRIIASSNRNLHQLMEQGLFRQDLFYRLNVVPVDLPPLRDRLQDIGALAAYFAYGYSAQSGMPVCEFSEAALAAMQAYDWPGNVRQLRNAIEWVMIMNGGASQPIRPEQLPPELISAGEAPRNATLSRDLISVSLREAREIFERDYLLSQIRRFGGNISKTAQFVGMERSALHRKLKQLGISELTRHDNEAEEEASAENRRIA